MLEEVLARRIPVVPPAPPVSDGLADLLGFDRQPRPLPPAGPLRPERQTRAPDGDPALLSQASSLALPKAGPSVTAQNAAGFSTPQQTSLAKEPGALLGGEGLILEDASEQPARMQNSPALIDPGPPTRDFVDEFAMYDALKFDPSGPSRIAIGIRMPLSVAAAFQARDNTDRIVAKIFGSDNKAHNNDADAFRHALWSYKLTKELGPEVAKQLADSLEISFPSPAGDRLMDLFNNNVGRRLAMDPKNRDLPDEEVIMKALREGKLQTEFFRVRPVPGALRPSGTQLRPPGSPF
ncbi:MAG: hypothetical protein MJE12_06990 [Alphaproteobacteria bacterium]|nr:hypothetical protein [Alphaproteobacteria bacterium]